MIAVIMVYSGAAVKMVISCCEFDGRVQRSLGHNHIKLIVSSSNWLVVDDYWLVSGVSLENLFTNNDHEM